MLFNKIHDETTVADIGGVQVKWSLERYFFIFPQKGSRLSGCEG
jgi:hypothetical protein